MLLRGPALVPNGSWQNLRTTLLPFAATAEPSGPMTIFKGVVGFRQRHSRMVGLAVGRVSMCLELPSPLQVRKGKRWNTYSRVCVEPNASRRALDLETRS